MDERKSKAKDDDEPEIDPALKEKRPPEGGSRQRPPLATPDSAVRTRRIPIGLTMEPASEPKRACEGARAEQLQLEMA